MPANDRQVHAVWEGTEVVRYDRASKWYVETTGSPVTSRQHVTIGEAARVTVEAGGTVREGIGGRKFLATVRALREQKRLISADDFSPDPDEMVPFREAAHAIGMQT